MTTYAPAAGEILPIFSGQPSFTRSASATGINSLYDRLIPKIFNVDDPSQGISTWTLYTERCKINELSKLSENWDSFGSAPPDHVAIQKSLSLIDQLYQLATISGLFWSSPHISASECGEVVFEWWSGKNKLTVYVGVDSVAYIKVWGLDIVNEMSDGILTKANFQDLWKWLHG